MTIALFLAAALGAQSAAAAPVTSDSAVEQTEVAFHAISEGDSRAAISAIEARLDEQPGDPALLINLGAAHQQIGDDQDAANAYRAAMDSSTRYWLELADGTWLDSRTAAKRALDRLERNSTIALR